MREWKESELGDIAKVQTGPFGSQLLNEQYITGGTPIITVEHIKNFEIAKLNYPSVTEEDRLRLERYSLKEGDIVFSRVGSVDLSAMTRKENEGWLFSSRMLRVRPDLKKIDPNYLAYYFRLDGVRKYINNVAVGSTMPSINTSILKTIPIKFPEKIVQTQIGKTLSVLDDKINLLRQQNETLEELAQLLFRRWFVDFEFPDKDGKPYKSNGGNMVESELREIPAEWEVSSLGENVETLGGGTPSTTEESYWTNGNILWYSPTDLTAANAMFSDNSAKNITKLGLQKSSAKLFPPYSLLMSSRATVGLMTINTKEASTNQGFIIVIPNDKFSIYFLYGWLKTKLKEIHTLASGSTFPEISKTDFRGLDLMVPTKDIKDGFDKLSKPIFKNIENNLKEIQTLTQLRDTLLPKLMSGEVRVKTD